MSRPADVIPSLAGVAVLDTLQAIRELVGEEPYNRALQALPANMRSEFEATTALSWVPNTLVGALIDAIAHAAQREPEAMLDAAVRIAVSRTFTTVWRVLLRVTTDAALIARTPIIYARSRNVGRLTSSVVSPGKGEIILSEWPDVTARHLRTIGVGIVCVVQLAGRTDVHIACTRRADGAQYILSWKP